MTNRSDLKQWLRVQSAAFKMDPIGIFQREGTNANWPLTAASPDELAEKLAAGGHLSPLPSEPAALANVVEVSLVGFLLERARDTQGVVAKRGTERGYPDLEISGQRFGGGHHAIEIKVARRSSSEKSTQSKITLYTGNTYFRYPDVHFAGSTRPFADYQSHLDVICLYTFAKEASGRIQNPELIIQEPWRIASRHRSSGTREYIGAVPQIERLRSGKGDFKSEAEFYKYWRDFDFSIPKRVRQELDRLLLERRESSKQNERG